MMLLSLWTRIEKKDSFRYKFIQIRDHLVWPRLYYKKKKELLRHMASLFKSTVIATQKKIKGLNTILLTSPIVALVQCG